MNTAVATSIPPMTTIAATDAQIGFIGRLLSQKAASAEQIADAVDAAYTGKAAASAAIETLLGLGNKPVEVASAPAATVFVPSGRYAVENADGELRFYKVDNVTEGRWAGRTFVSVQASDSLFPVKGAAGLAVLAKIAVDAKAAMLRYGREIGECGHCGRVLTNETSRAAGIGAVCSGKIAF